MKALLSFYEKFSCNIELCPGFFGMKMPFIFNTYFIVSKKNLIPVHNNSAKIFVSILKYYVFIGVLSKQD